MSRKAIRRVLTRSLISERIDDPHAIKVMLARRIGANADSEEVARFAAVIWREIGDALSPMFGEAGVAALYRRSLELTRFDHPCLLPVCQTASHADSSGLQLALAQRPPDVAAHALVDLLTNFHNLLTNLIGGSMLNRLLRSLWDKPGDGTPNH